MSVVWLVLGCLANMYSMRLYGFYVQLLFGCGYCHCNEYVRAWWWKWWWRRDSRRQEGNEKMKTKHALCTHLIHSRSPYCVATAKSFTPFYQSIIILESWFSRTQWAICTMPQHYIYGCGLWTSKLRQRITFTFGNGIKQRTRTNKKKKKLWDENLKANIRQWPVYRSRSYTFNGREM